MMTATAGGATVQPTEIFRHYQKQCVEGFDQQVGGKKQAGLLSSAEYVQSVLSITQPQVG